MTDREDRPPDPGVGGEYQVAQGLDERPLAVHRLVQQFGRQAPGPFGGLAPHPPEDVPRLAETGRVCRAHLGPVGVPPVELRIDQRRDVDAIDRHILDLAVDVHADQFDAPHHGPAQVHPAEPGAGQVHGVELHTAEVSPLEPGAAEIGTDEVSHPATLTPRSDDPPHAGLAG